MSTDAVTPRARLFDKELMTERRSRIHAYARERASEFFAPDGSYRSGTEPDGRIAYWYAPTLLEDAASRALGRAVLNAAAGWERFDIFMSSATAGIVARQGEHLGDELRKKALKHLNEHVLRDRGRAPSAAVYDYQSHGYNDNMPCMAVRALLLGAAVLKRADLRDAGMHHLETVAEQLERRGLLSEYSSPTYTPISCCALLDVAEFGPDSEARTLAQACADRVLLDMLAHWHAPSAGSGASASRAYTVDCTGTASNLNMYLWYLGMCGPLLDPLDLLSDAKHASPLHHARNHAFNLAQWLEMMEASHAGVRQDLVAWVRQERAWPYEVLATSDWGESGVGGSVATLTRSHQTARWWLGTSSTVSTGGCAGQQQVLHGGLLAAEGKTWRDKVTLWHKLFLDTPEPGDEVTVGASPHAGALAGADLTKFRAETDNVHDWGWYTTAQKGGSAMLLGGLGPDAETRKFQRATFALMLAPFGRQPDEIFDDQQPVSQWGWGAGACAGRWTYLRFGSVYLALRLAGADHGRKLEPRRVEGHGYLRFELPLIASDSPQALDKERRKWLDFGLLIEIADAEECGDFAAFRSQVANSAWELAHGYHRHARFRSRHGDLEISDSGVRGTSRFIAVDARTEDWPRFSATEMPETLAELIPGQRVRRRRVLYRDHVQTPFYNNFSQIIASDLPGAEW